MLMLAVVTSVAVGCTTKSVPPPQTEALGARSFARQWATDLADGRANPITAIHLVDKFVFAYRQDGSSAVIDRTQRTADAGRSAGRWRQWIACAGGLKRPDRLSDHHAPGCI